jgi:hypothetical protein
MTTWHVVTLALEMLGFGLAYIHVFHERIAQRASTGALWIRDVWPTVPLVISPGIDYADPPIPMELRTAATVNKNIFLLLQIALVIILVRKLNFGSGFGWGFLEFLAAMVLSLPLSLILFLILLLLPSAVVALAVEAGRGNIVAGIGFVLAALGILIETVEVLRSELWWTLAALWGIALLVVLSVGSRATRRPDDSG